MPWEFFDRPASQVEANIAGMNARADETMNVALGIVDRLGAIEFNPAGESPPNMDLPDVTVPEVVTPRGPERAIFGNIGDLAVPDFDDLWSSLGLSLSDPVIPEFESTVGAITIPEAPPPIDTNGMPERPDVGDVVIPLPPSIIMPEVGDLAEIVIPDFEFPALPLWDGSEPTFDVAPPSTSAFVWDEPAYAPEILDEVQAEVRRMLQGGTGLPVQVQQALFDAARERESQTALGAKQQAYDEFAARGFTMPTGYLAKLVEGANERAQLEANAQSRDILTKAAQWEIENLRFAVEKGIAIEGVLINIFLNAATRSFEAAKYRLQADIETFNSQVTLFNARQSAYQVAATVFKTRVETALATLEVFKAQIQGAIAKGQLNEQTVKVYAARLDGLRALTEVYKSRMQGAQVQADIAKTAIEGYRADVQAYGERLDAQKSVYTAYESRIKGESTKAQVFEAQARAYAATVQAAEAKGNAKVAYINARIGAMRASVDKFTALLQAERERVTAQATDIQAQAQSYTADIGRYSAEIAGVNAQQSTKVQVTEMRLRNQLAYYEARLREYDAAMGRLISKTQIITDALKASGQMATTLTAGAMSAIHVQAGMSGSASVGDHQSYNVNINRQGADAA